MEMQAKSLLSICKWKYVCVILRPFSNKSVRLSYKSINNNNIDSPSYLNCVNRIILATQLYKKYKQKTTQ